jgi:SAM-dependent methyltransferase
MSWPEIKAAYTELRSARDAEIALDDTWSTFVGLVRAAEAAPPYHLRLVLSTAAQVCGARERKDCRIVDHGCGSGLPVLYLIALGYEAACGVNITPHCLQWNEALKRLFEDQEDRFSMYDGRHLAIADRSVDLIFSQQVLEHVHDDVFDAFYSEEGRVMKPGAKAVHQVPHLLVPFESHSNTWFIHWLPRVFQMPIYRALKVRLHSVQNDLFLRSPKRHIRKLEHHIGPTKNLTHLRLESLRDIDYYDGPVRLRRAITQIVNIPVIGRMFSLFLSRLMMLETVSEKTVSR